MREIHWDLMGPALGHALFYTALLSLAYTLLGMFIMKYFVPKVPLISHAIILFWAIFRVMLVAIVLIFAGVMFNISAGPLSGVLSLLGMCAVGWLITRHMTKNYGTPTKFPAVGAKVMFSTLVLMWVLIIIVYVATLVFGAP